MGCSTASVSPVLTANPEIAPSKRRLSFLPDGPNPFDVVTLGIAAAAILLFLATGGTVLPDLVLFWRGMGSKPDAILGNALILNIAVILFGWSRYKTLSRELLERRRSEEAA